VVDGSGEKSTENRINCLSAVSAKNFKPSGKKLHPGRAETAAAFIGVGLRVSRHLRRWAQPEKNTVGTPNLERAKGIEPLFSAPRKILIF
jgi:hypothetical protein